MSGAKKKEAERTEEQLVSDQIFQSVRATVLIQNTTTHTNQKSPEGNFLVEIGEKSMALEVPARTCSVGHNLIISILAQAPGKKDFEFKVTAKVDLAEQTPEGSSQIGVTLIQYEEKEWNQFLSLFKARQSEIEDFFKAARGW